MYELDETDEAIIDVLLKNARLSTREIAKKSGIPAATVHKRMKKLEKEGVIAGYSVRINKAKLGKEAIAYVLVRTKPGSDFPTMIKELKSHDVVEDIAALAGEFDLIVKVRARNIKELNQFVLGHLRKFEAVTQTQTLIVFTEYE